MIIITCTFILCRFPFCFFSLSLSRYIPNIQQNKTTHTPRGKSARDKEKIAMGSSELRASASLLCCDFEKIQFFFFFFFRSERARFACVSFVVIVSTISTHTFVCFCLFSLTRSAPKKKQQQQKKESK